MVRRNAPPIAPAAGADLPAPASRRLGFPLDSVFRGSRDRFAVAGLASLLLAVVACLMGVERLHIHAISNDQVGYVLTARRWLATGRPNSPLIYPAHLRPGVTKSYFYMPGQFAVLALAFGLLGDSPVTAVIPSMLFFVIAALGVFMLTRRLYGRVAAWWSVGAFGLLPDNLLYACSAMCESAVVAGWVGVVAGFFWLPVVWRPWIAPLLLVPAFCFRETSALLVIPLAYLMWRLSPRRSRWRTGWFVAASAALLSMIFFSALAEGRPDLLRPNILDRGSFAAVYNDAFRMNQVPDRLHDWLSALLRGVLENCAAIPCNVLRRPLGTESWLIIMLLLSTWFCFRSPWNRRGADPYPIAIGICGIVMLGFVFACYQVSGSCGLRALLGLFALSCPIWGRDLARLTQRRAGDTEFTPKKTLRRLALGVLTAWILLWSGKAHDLIAGTRIDAKNRGLFRSLALDPRTLLISSPDALETVMLDRIAAWSFIPANRATLDLVARRQPIGVALIADDDPQTQLRPADWRAHGLEPSGERFQHGIRYQIYRRPSPRR